MLKPRRFTPAPLRILVFGLCVGSSALACSTFVLEKGNRSIYAHHLDHPGEVPGMVVINRRDAVRRGASWAELCTGHPVHPAVGWKARWGSITFNTWGVGFPDGGMNERGLYVQEMSLPGSRGPSPAGRPILFPSVWIQYALDRCETTDEVVQTLAEFSIQENPSPFEWHYLVADHAGDRAIIEFVAGQVVVHRREAMPLPLLCNDRYDAEIEAWNDFVADGIDNAKTPERRFLRGARTLARTEAAGASPDRALQVLESLQNSSTRWSIVFDGHAREVRYRTRVSPAWKSFSWVGLDFSPGPTLAWDIDGGSREQWFKPISADENRRQVDRSIDALQALIGRERFEAMLESMGGSSERLRATVADATRWQ